MDRFVIEPDFAVLEFWIIHAGDCAQGRGFARPVTAQQRENFTFVNVKADTLDDVTFAVVGFDVPDR